MKQEQVKHLKLSQVTDILSPARKGPGRSRQKNAGQGVFLFQQSRLVSALTCLILLLSLFLGNGLLVQADPAPELGTEDTDPELGTKDNPIYINGGLVVSPSESAQETSPPPITPTSGLDVERTNKSSEYPFRIEPTLNPPVFYLTGYELLQFEMKNVSDASLHIEEVFLKSGGEGFPFEATYTKIVGATGSDNLGRGQTTSVTIAPQWLKSGATDGYYSLEITVRYREDSSSSYNYNDIYEQTLSYTIRVVGNPDNKTDSRILLAPALLPTQTGTYGQALNLQFGLVNRGFDPVDVISVTPIIKGEADSWPFVITQTDYTQAVGRQLLPLAPGAGTGSEASGTMILCNFGLLTVREDISSGPKQIEFLVKHKYGNQEIQETTFPIFVNIVGNPAEDNKANGGSQETWPDSKPRLMCTGFKTNPDKVQGGEDFKLTLTIKNTSALLGVQNIRLVVSSDPVGEAAVPPFITESGASSVFIPWIDPDTEYELDLMMTASVQVPQKAYPLKLEMEYEDVKASPIQANEAISIQLNQAVRMDHGKMELMPEQINVGQQTSLNFPLYNKGKTTLYNVTVTVPDNQGITGDEIFLGNLNAGASSLVDMMITADAVFSPEDPRKLKVSYEDENGQVSSEEIEFKLTVMEDMDMGGMDFPGDMPPWADDPSMGEMEVPTGPLAIMPLWAWILCGVGLFLVLLGVILSVRKRKRKKRMTMEDEAYFRDLMS